MVPRRRRCCAAKVAPPGAWRDIAGPAAGPMDPDYDYMTFPEVVASAVDAYAQARIKDPRQALAMAEVHDCFTPTELVLMEDLGFAARGTAWKEVLAGTFRPRRRAQVLRPSDRRLRAPDALRGVAPAPWRGGETPDRLRRARAQARPHAQPRRRTGRVRVARRDRRVGAERSKPGPTRGFEPCITSDQKGYNLTPRNGERFAPT